jgi:hypothetical protein
MRCPVPVLVICAFGYLHIHAKQGGFPSIAWLLWAILSTAKALQHRDPPGSNNVSQNIQRWNCSYVLDEVEVFEI